MVVVVLPTPPFWLHMASTRAGPCLVSLRGSGKTGVGRPVGPTPRAAAAEAEAGMTPVSVVTSTGGSPRARVRAAAAGLAAAALRPLPAALGAAVAFAAGVALVALRAALAAGRAGSAVAVLRRGAPFVDMEMCPSSAMFPTADGANTRRAARRTTTRRGH